MKEIEKLSLFFPLVIGEKNPTLRKHCEEVQNFDQEIENFAEVLIELMYYHEGVGLAAPQLGKNIRMVAVTQWKEKGKTKKLLGEKILVNPVLLEHSKETILFEEGCLSLPETFGNVRRYQTIKVSYLDEQGLKHTEQFSGYNAIIVQHEMDHLDGILFVDKLTKA